MAFPSGGAAEFFVVIETLWVLNSSMTTRSVLRVSWQPRLQHFHCDGVVVGFAGVKV